MSCDWKSASACAQARRLLLLSLLLAGVTLLLAATASAAYSVTVTPGTVLNTGTGNGAKLGINLDHWWDSDANRLSGYTLLAMSLTNAKLKVRPGPTRSGRTATRCTGSSRSSCSA